MVAAFEASAAGAGVPCPVDTGCGAADATSGCGDAAAEGGAGVCATGADSGEVVAANALAGAELPAAVGIDGAVSTALTDSGFSAGLARNIRYRLNCGDLRRERDCMGRRITLL